MSARAIVTEQEVDDAVHFLRTSAVEIGLARGRLIKAEKMVKHIEALAAKFSEEKTSAAKKIDALSSDRYVAAIESEANAAAQFEELKGLREAAVAVIEVWRTQSSNLRGKL